MTLTKPIWRTPLIILIAGCVILTLSMGVRHTAGLFLQPMTLDHGWSRETFSFAIALQNLVWGLASPFAGALADRHGAGRTVVGAAVLYVLGLVLMSQAASPLAFDLTAGVLIGLGLSGTTFAVIMGVIGRHTTPEKRSLALGIASAGGSFGQFAVLPIGQALITAYGWQSALVLLACGVGLIAPLAYAMADGHKPAAGGGQSAIKSVYSDPKYVDYRPWNRAWAPQLDWQKDVWHVPQFFELLTQQQDQFDLAITGKQDAKTTLDNIAKFQQNLLTEAGLIQ